jgi:hypothetical protein
VACLESCVGDPPGSALIAEPDYRRFAADRKASDTRPTDVGRGIEAQDYRDRFGPVDERAADLLIERRWTSPRLPFEPCPLSIGQQLACPATLTDLRGSKVLERDGEDRRAPVVGSISLGVTVTALIPGGDTPSSQRNDLIRRN